MASFWQSESVERKSCVSSMSRRFDFKLKLMEHFRNNQIAVTLVQVVGMTQQSDCNVVKCLSS